MAFIIGLLINLLILALIVLIVLRVIDIAASAMEIPPKITGIIKAIIILLALLMFLSALTGGWVGFYPVHRIQ